MRAKCNSGGKEEKIPKLPPGPEKPLSRKVRLVYGVDDDAKIAV